MAVVSKNSTNTASNARDFKHKVLTCLNKLSDRDTYTSAVTDLESIAKTLTHETIPPFLSSIIATDSSERSPVRKQCVRLISILSESHGNLLSSHLSKLISSIIRRLRDPDSSVRTACVTAIGSISSHITKPPFTLIVKPLVDALVTEQELNSQIGAALCVAAAIDGSPDPDPVFLKRLVPRLEKLLRSESFKGKAALLTVYRSVIGAAGGGFSQQMVRNLVKCLTEFVTGDDWAARKAAAEAFTKLAVVERNGLSEYKASCLKIFEAKRYDKVKVVRETMNHMIEAWREIPDVSEEVSQPPESQASSKDVASDGRYPPGSKTSRAIASGAPLGKKNYSLANGSALLDYSSTVCARNSTPTEGSDKKTGPAMFRKLDRKKPSNQKVDTGTPVTVLSGYSKNKDENVFNKDDEINKPTKAETRRALFRNSEENMLNSEGSQAGSRMFPYHAEVSRFTTVASNITEDHHRSQKDSDDLSLIRKQLLQIENQQSSLLDLLQGFIGSSQNGIRSLESRVHGLELALDDISHDLAVSTARMSGTDSVGAACCKLPVADYLRSKLWRRTDGGHSISGYSASGGISSVAGVSNTADKTGNSGAFKLENRRFRLQGGSGFIVNPLAEVHSNSQGISELPSNRVSKNVHTMM